jgi:hypothetical protein
MYRNVSMNLSTTLDKVTAVEKAAACEAEHTALQPEVNVGAKALDWGLIANAATAAPPSSKHNPADLLSPPIRQISWFGGRAEFSQDGKTVS